MRIVDRKWEELRKQQVPIETLEMQAKTHRRRPFRQALKQSQPAIIAEIKKASPSKGLLAEEFRPTNLAQHYEAGGAAALSVLTDQDFFQGCLADMEAARAATTLPVLRKDFMVAPYQIAQSAAYGADAILLIAAILDVPQLREFREYASTFEMDSLVEVHDETELEKALESGAVTVGVNNRDLRTFEVHLETSHRLASLIPDDVVRVAESGIATRGDIANLSEFQAFLVGESLMRAENPAQALRELRACS